MMTLKKHIKRRLSIRGILSVIVVLIIIRQLFHGNYEQVFIGVLTLFLFALPPLIDRQMGIDLPSTLETVILVFIFASEILGEVGSFYTRVPLWDTMLHAVTGFITAAFGFALVDIFNRSKRFTFKLSPLFLAFVAFCFSMTIGVLWEFFEFGVDWLFDADMQKDFVITSINSVKFDPDGLNNVQHIEIESIIVNGEDWKARFGGYLDIGLVDTMKDLFVNFIGAIIFSVIGYFYIKNRGRGFFAKQFVPVVKAFEEDEPVFLDEESEEGRPEPAERAINRD